MWNEPDRPASFKGKQADFFSVWVHTARLIRSTLQETPPPEDRAATSHEGELQARTATSIPTRARRGGHLRP